jgi:hypothetical protein
VSLIVQPGDTRYLADSSLATKLYDMKLSLMKKAAKPYFWWAGRPKHIKGSEILSE